MKTTFGSMPATMPPGFFKAVHFPKLAGLDEQTGDHRMLAGDGGTVRPLPLSIRAAFDHQGGHFGAVPTGTLFEVVLDSETGEFSGSGFLLNDEFGRRHARMIATGAMRTNSVDLAEVKARLEEEMDTGEWWVLFTQWSLAATTGVGTPAFADASIELLDKMTEEELTASLGDPMEALVCEFDTIQIRIEGSPEMEEITASAGTILAPFESFYRPESARPHKIQISADGEVFGHLGQWNTCHDGITDKCTIIPRPTDGYASFNQPGILTERGTVQTGPIFAFGGHRPSNGAKTLNQAYGGIENSWCDVRVVEGKFGPWVSGWVRPGTPDEVVYAARASRISGHWLGDKLKAIVSVNVEGYRNDGTLDDAELDLVAGFAFSVNDDGVSELIASFPECGVEVDDGLQLTMNFNLNANVDVVRLTEVMREAVDQFNVEPTVQVEAAADDEPSHTADDDLLLSTLLADEDDL